ncbi:MAG: hypothetical protein HXY40_08410 [Chloroflexi bacterium]|nr:hypothetical protein [Chloroflexota bacterium]
MMADQLATTLEKLEDVQAIYDSGKPLLALINEILESRLKGKPITVEIVEESAIPAVAADAIRLRQIMLNLLGNAVKFTEQGTITLSYGLYNDREVYVKVKDTGMGINAANLRLVFERFRQVDGSSTRRAGGTGLGLSITQQLVHLHGGEIYAESEGGAGSTFWFTLPVTEEQPAAALAEANGASKDGKAK